MHEILNLSESNILNLVASQEKDKVAPGCQHLPYPAFSDNGFFHMEIFGGGCAALGGTTATFSGWKCGHRWGKFPYGE